MLLGSGGAGAPLSSMHVRKSSSFFLSASERFGPWNDITPTPPPGAGAEKVAVPLALLALSLPLSAIETAATPTAVIPAASRDSPRGPSLMVSPLFLFFSISTPVRRFPDQPGLATIKPAGHERRLRRG